MELKRIITSLKEPLKQKLIQTIQMRIKDQHLKLEELESISLLIGSLILLFLSGGAFQTSNLEI